MKLTAEGQRIALTRHPVVEVSSGPGCGKTTVIVARCKHLISKGQKPDRILILSFSKAATANLRERLSDVEGGADIAVSTCHAYALSLLQQNLRLLGLNAVPSLLSEEDARTRVFTAVEEPIGALNRQARSSTALERNAIDKKTSWLVAQQGSEGIDRLIDLFSYARAARVKIMELADRPQNRWIGSHLDTVLMLRRHYRERLTKTRSMDYGDMIRLANKALGTTGKVTGAKFDHLLVDEYQDTTPAQSLLFYGLHKRIANLMVVGDPRQAIFGFGGAQYTPLAEIVGGAKLLPLSYSHRLTQATADLANAIDAPAGHRHATPAFTGRAGGAKPILILAKSEADQAQNVVRRISRLLASGVAADEIMILARHKASLKPIHRALSALNIKSERQGQVTDMAHVARVVALAKIVESADTPETGAKLAFKRFSSEADTQLAAAAYRAVRTASKSKSLEGRYRGCAAAYLIALGGVRSNPDAQACLDIWQPLCRKFETASQMRKAILDISEHPAIKTSTIHAAKGHEWAYVFVVGVSDGVLPDYRAQTKAALAEERSLMFVAITRASEHVTLSFTPQSVARHRQKPVDSSTLSRFLDSPKAKLCMNIE